MEFSDLLLRDPSKDLREQYPATDGQDRLYPILGGWGRVRVDARDDNTTTYYLSYAGDVLPDWMGNERTDYAEISFPGLTSLGWMAEGKINNTVAPPQFEPDSFVFTGEVEGISSTLRSQLRIWVGVSGDFTSPGQTYKARIRIQRTKSSLRERRLLTVQELVKIATYVSNNLTPEHVQISST